MERYSRRNPFHHLPKNFIHIGAQFGRNLQSPPSQNTTWRQTCELTLHKSNPNPNVWNSLWYTLPLVCQRPFQSVFPLSLDLHSSNQSKTNKYQFKHRTHETEKIRRSHFNIYLVYDRNDWQLSLKRQVEISNCLCLNPLKKKINTVFNKTRSFTVTA